ncbi:MAG: S-layer homology domain-containing protein [bacterium]|nr:S-layer homology domain-containing protein [bacterium]MDP3381538.1 S-layer homology domain-containing protein [bacterium]
MFSDINSNYKYLNELQTLYDKGMIFPDKNGKFNPNELLNRDEFV